MKNDAGLSRRPETGSLVSGLRVVRVLWLGLAASSPLFAVEFFRYESVRFYLHATIPSLVVAAILVVGTLDVLRQAVLQGRIAPRGAIPSLRQDRTLLVLLFLLVAWHFVGWARSDFLLLGRRETIKMVFDGLTVVAIVAFFPRDSGFIRRYWKLTIGSAAVLTLLLLYQYAFTFQSPFLGSDLFSWTNSAKSGFVWHLMTPLVLSLCFFCCRGRRVFHFVPLLILSTALVYVASRGAWVSVGCGMVGLVLLTGLRTTAQHLLWLGVAALLGIAALEVTVPGPLDFEDRMLWFLDPSDCEMGEDNIDCVEETGMRTIGNRSGLIADGWECFRRAPVFGIGLGSTAECFRGLLSPGGQPRTNLATHLDYLLVASDLGIVGLAVFLSVLVCFGATLVRSSRRNSDSGNWVAQGGLAAFIAMLVSMLVINVYTTPFFWLSLGLFYVEAISKRNGESGQ